ncbi:MAG: M56 family metallopeptidase [Firmicutes bacterium]|nr:M56 family metallopeptidase [Bacillota bacterium]
MSHLLLLPALQRWGLSLFHSLWELSLLGLVAWVGLAMLRRRSAKARYGFACAVLAAMVFAPFITFVVLNPSSTGGLLPPGTFQILPLDEGLAPSRSGASWMPALFAALWVFGALFMLGRLGGGIWWLERAYVRSGHWAPRSLHEQLEAVARRMKLRTLPQLRVSERVPSPLLVGWWRPVLLLPSAALLNLSPQALEAVLAHELAHLLRRDHFVNLLQSLAEALLFFHPAVWWLSRQVKELREHCCDDAAVALCGDPLILAQGLSALERLRRTRLPEPALAAVKGPLMSRIQRLFSPHCEPLPSLRGLLLGALGASLLVGTTLVAQTAAKKTKPAAKPSSPTKAEAGQPVTVDYSQVKVRHQPPAPAYPPKAKEARIQGTVVVEVLIDEEGVPLDVKAIEGPEELRATAVDYANQWRFEPAKIKGKTVKTKFKLTMPFRLK